MDFQALEAVFARHGFEGCTWMRAEDIVVAQWVRNKCVFGCESYGRRACCPPHTPSVEACREFFSEYRHVALFHFQKSFEDPKDRVPWSRDIDDRLYRVECEVFLAGWHKAFLLPMSPCRICPECVGVRQGCVNKKQARPTPEAMAMDVFSTVRPYGLPIEVLKDYQDLTNRYAFLLVD